MALTTEAAGYLAAAARGVGGVLLALAVLRRQLRAATLRSPVWMRTGWAGGHLERGQSGRRG